MAISLVSANVIYRREAAFRTYIEKRGEAYTHCVTNHVKNGINEAALAYPNAKEALDLGANTVIQDCLPRYTDLVNHDERRKGMVICVMSAYLKLSKTMAEAGSSQEEIDGVLAILSEHQSAAMDLDERGCNDDS
ncbi:hypothetical protein AJ78_04077 [Emergomyces pasteurianus Ep9510]|uniref:Uncharacterized protein n=1 Tax=Emergomyces pasteurianus Ep9510 TaxID=1447872 RepID=A0A1J9QII3_9EURO|nr:hypothetical protein AJ78_04077 [Emergomyces pasteurianus Ep9510]